ncbi:GNAT family N-acetyltransferase [Algibacillus agarilyticus]|uniref:GNAT family N-acetyltransferase n=1 Tax=Algibacillus agarilyticus TaxID=2234133 RepID=UPI001E6151D9|nr:GNAT family N-acetyltransferase [Algibacillus agarilyticus]
MTMIETVSKTNLPEVLPLIRQYQAFYNVADISDEKNAAFFSQFNNASPLGCQFIAREHNEVVGFATVYFSFTSTITAKVAVLNDLYIQPHHRGKGIGRQLVDYCHQYAKDKGAARLQWVTAPDNEPAKRLYDSLNTTQSTWLFYAYN